MRILRLLAQAVLCVASSAVLGFWAGMLSLVLMPGPGGLAGMAGVVNLIVGAVIGGFVGAGVAAYVSFKASPEVRFRATLGLVCAAVAASGFGFSRGN